MNITPGYYQQEPCGCRLSYITDLEKQNKENACDYGVLISCSLPDSFIWRARYYFIIYSSKLDFNR